MEETDYFLIVTAWLLLLTAWLSVMGNGTILLTVTKNPPLRKRDCLYLIAALAVADFLTGIYWVVTSDVHGPAPGREISVGRAGPRADF